MACSKSSHLCVPNTQLTRTVDPVPLPRRYLPDDLANQLETPNHPIGYFTGGLVSLDNAAAANESCAIGRISEADEERFGDERCEDFINPATPGLPFTSKADPLFQSQSAAVVLPCCGNKVHRQDILRWIHSTHIDGARKYCLDNHNKCPMCRGKLFDKANVCNHLDALRATVRNIQKEDSKLFRSGLATITVRKGPLISAFTMYCYAAVEASLEWAGFGLTKHTIAAMLFQAACYDGQTMQVPDLRDGLADAGMRALEAGYSEEVNKNPARFEGFVRTVASYAVVLYREAISGNGDFYLP